MLISKHHHPQRLSALLEGFVSVPVEKDCEISGLATDSRLVLPGDLFLACQGQQARGHDFIADAIRKGAVAVVYETNNITPIAQVPLIAMENLRQCVGNIAERFFGYPSQEMFVIGVTGTNGKTSCTQFLAQALNTPDAPCGVLGTLGNGLYGRLQTANNTTPDPIELHKMLADMRSKASRTIAMEVSSHGLEQGRVNGVKFDAAVFTNLTRDHLDYHKDMATYGAAKQRLFAMPTLRYAVINRDDVFSGELLEKIKPTIETVVYGLIQRENEVRPAVWGEVLHMSRQGFEMQVITAWGNGILHSRLLGRFNASNLLAALSVLLLMKMPLIEALEKLGQAKTVPGRMESFGGQHNQPLVVVDYAHTPDALQSVLQALRDHCRGELWCVFGCGGNRDQGKRPLMGAIAEELADQVILTDDNPRYEVAANIIADIVRGMRKAPAHIVPDRAGAIAYAINHANAQDVVLIAGKGHEDYQQVGDTRLVFSDRVQAQALLQEVA